MQKRYREGFPTGRPRPMRTRRAFRYFWPAIPLAAGLPPDSEAAGALSVLAYLRDSGDDRPVLMLTMRAMGLSEVEEYCTPDNRAIALPLAHLPKALAGFVGMLRQPPERAWHVIEVEIKDQVASCHIGNGYGRQIRWGNAPLWKYSQVPSMAGRYIKLDSRSAGWVRQIHADGAQIFHDLVISVLGPGLFAHLEIAAGGLEKLAFRFRVDNPALHTAPFEAAVRRSAQPLTNTDIDFTHSPFVLVNAPITRRLRGTVIRVLAPIERVPRPARVLFIRSQMGEHPEGATDSETLEVSEPDRTTGGRKLAQKAFLPLKNIDVELAGLQAFGNRIALKTVNLSLERDPARAAVVLARALAEGPYDVVHFAGHSLTTSDGSTLLVLPGAQPGEAAGLAVETFADGVAKASVRLVYHSSCESSSAVTVASLGQRGVPHVLGFRWEVEDDRAASFAKFFYDRLFRDDEMICHAFRTACRRVYVPEKAAESSIWASPILASQPDDWMAQCLI